MSLRIIPMAVISLCAALLVAGALVRSAIAEDLPVLAGQGHTLLNDLLMRTLCPALVRPA